MQFKQKLYGRRQSFLSKEAEELLSTSNIVIKDKDLANLKEDYFSNIASDFKDITLEIGTGYGEHIFNLAINNSDKFYIACEVYLNGVASLLKKVKLHDKSVDNLIIFNADARELLQKLPSSYLSSVMLLFPDPWPKKRHNKRRFISQKNIEQVCRVLKQGSTFRFATDHEDYAIYGNKFLNGFDGLSNIKLEDGLKEPENHLITRYEQKAIEKQSNIYYFDYCKK